MLYSYCPKCGQALQRRLIDEVERLACSSCGFIFYQNSKPCVGVLAVKEGQLLLVRRAIEPYYGYWDIPGGFLEAGEHPEAGAIREMEEETGLVIEPVEILGLYMSTYGPAGEPTLNICYVATSYISLNVRSFFSAKARLMLRRTSKQQDAAIGRKFALKSRYFWYINNRIQAIGALPPGLAELQGRI